MVTCVQHTHIHTQQLEGAWLHKRSAPHITIMARRPLAARGDYTRQESVVVIENSEPTTKHAFSRLSVVWHATMFLFYVLLIIFGLKMSVDLLPYLKGRVPTIGGPFKYLTHINLWLQLLFFGLQLAADLGCLCKKRMQKVSSFIFATLALPTSATIVVTFWSVYFIDRNLIFPEFFDKVFPWYMNHFWHTTIVVWVLCELYLVSHQFPGTLIGAITIIFFNSIYISWIFFIYGKTGHWVYPFLERLSPVQLVLFFASSMFMTFGFYYVGKCLSHVTRKDTKKTH